ncbi:Alcohol dehydrogenase A [Eumeta japonica]|uniref:Alcohol dehydrogenase A n=1 Tax=Eumeta variegata TaxID=151549 RepID=A0A4C1XKJ1_EUMVA|nr:Alcohol dehydrogenase A [Eumeta japonica]
MASKVPKVRFYNGYEIPILGLGTWKSKPGEVTQAVKDAIDIGYRHIDCAHVYGNEREVGEALTTKINEGIIKREDVFITSKLWNTFHRPDLVEPALRTTLANLQTTYLDLYLIHWPHAYKEDGEMFPADENGKIQFSDVDYVDTWKAMEQLVNAGLVRSIGISNFNAKQIDRLLEVAKIKPVVNQVECHPYLNQRRLFAHCKARDIALTAYSPLGSPDRPWAKPGDPQLLEDARLKEIAGKYGKTTAQVLIRYQIERGVIVIPKSVNRDRLQQNFDVFDFALTSDDVSYIDTLDVNGRLIPMTAALGHKYHPFENDEF